MERLSVRAVPELCTGFSTAFHSPVDGPRGDIADTDSMPELPEVEALAGFLRERVVGHAIARIDVLAARCCKRP
jgi:hypothetical protein